MYSLLGYIRHQKGYNSISEFDLLKVLKIDKNKFIIWLLIIQFKKKIEFDEIDIWNHRWCRDAMIEALSK